MMDKVNILGVMIHNISLKKTLEKIEKFIKLKKKNYTIFTPNVNMTVRTLKDKKLKQALMDADLLVPDGMPLVWASKLFKNSLKEKVEGSDIFFDFCELASLKGYRIFLMGAKEGVAERAVGTLKNKHIDLEIVGTYSPLFGFENDLQESKKMVKLLEESRADVLFVGLSEGKGEKWINENKDKYRIPVSIQVGASFDIAAGDKKMAPQFLKNIGFAWCWRLIQEPGRLWKRYLIHDMKFFYYIGLQLFTKRFGN